MTGLGKICNLVFGAIVLSAEKDLTIFISIEFEDVSRLFQLTDFVQK